MSEIFPTSTLEGLSQYGHNVVFNVKTTSLWYGRCMDVETKINSAFSFFHTITHQGLQNLS